MQKKRVIALGGTIGVFILLILLTSTPGALAAKKPCNVWTITFSGCITTPDTVTSLPASKNPSSFGISSATLIFSNYWSQYGGLVGTFSDSPVSIIKVKSTTNTWSVGISLNDTAIDRNYFIHGYGTMTFSGLDFTFVPSGTYDILIYDDCCSIIWKGDTTDTPNFRITGLVK